MAGGAVWGALGGTLGSTLILDLDQFQQSHTLKDLPKMDRLTQ